MMTSDDKMDRLKSLGYLATNIAELEEKEEMEKEEKLKEISSPIVKSNTFQTPPIYYDLPFGARLTGAKKLHQAGMTGKGIKIGIVDCGVDDKHPMLHGKIERRYWYRSFTPLRHKHYHGTHIAGTIHNMAPDAEICDYRVFGQVGKLSTKTAVSTAIFQAYREGCRVINVGCGWSYDVPEIRNIMKYVSDRGVVVCAAAGNAGRDQPLTNERSWPAFYLEAIGVAAWYKKDGQAVASFSGDRSQSFDFVGYGDNVISLQPGGGFKCLSGTSIACPHVTGFIACLMSKDIIKNEGEKTNAILREKLKAYTLDIGLEGPGNTKGLGFLTYLTKDEFNEMFYGIKAVKEEKPAKKVTFEVTEEIENKMEKEQEKEQSNEKKKKRIVSYWASNTTYEKNIEEDFDSVLWC